LNASQPRPAYATRHGTFQQANDILVEKYLEKEKATATRVKPQCGKVDALKDKCFGWMWLIKIYKWRRSAIYSLTLTSLADTQRDTHETKPA
jgi:hypothetical protein